MVAWGSQFGHTVDIGGPVSGSLPTDATTVFGEGTRIPPIKLFDRGNLNDDCLDLILNNSQNQRGEGAGAMAGTDPTLITNLGFLRIQYRF